MAFVLLGRARVSRAAAVNRKQPGMNCYWLAAALYVLGGVGSFPDTYRDARELTPGRPLAIASAVLICAAWPLFALAGLVLAISKGVSR